MTSSIDWPPSCPHGIALDDEGAPSRHCMFCLADSLEVERNHIALLMSTKGYYDDDDREDDRDHDREDA